MGQVHRRDAIRLGLGALTLAGCGPGQVRPVDRREPAAGAFEVRPDGCLLWVYSRRPVRLSVCPAHSESPLQSWALTPAAGRGFTAVQPVAGLASDTAYRYRLDGGPWHHLRTAPAPDADAPAHLAVLCDVHPWRKWASPILDTVRASAAAAAVSLGDWPYSDAPPAARTVAEYREKGLRARLQPEVRRLMQRVPLYGTWDDHELANDWDATWRADHPAQAKAGMQVWDELWPIATAPQRRYRSWRWGRHLECFLLDTRSHRSAIDAPDGPDKSMLGAAQRAWLVAGLAASTATFKVVFVSVPLAHGTTTEHFNAWPDERRVIEAAIAATSGAVVVSGDQHWFAAYRHASGVREYQFGPAQMVVRDPPPAAPGMLARLAVPNFGQLVVTPGASPRLHVLARGARGELLFQETVPQP